MRYGPALTRRAKIPGMLIDQVRTFCIIHQLFEPGSVVVAVSGGANSLALLHVLMALRDDFGLTLHIATFDHQLRGSVGASDVQFVCDLAKAWDVPVTAGSADVATLAERASLGIEAAARKVRYTFLMRVADQIGATVIATGHNQDDQAETVLMHVIRGAGLAGLRGMLPKTPLVTLIPDLKSPHSIVRPLLDIPRSAIDDYVTALGIQPRIDDTNADMAYTRNRLRHEVLPLLEQINPQVRRALARTGAIARDDYATLERFLPPLIQQGKHLLIDRQAFLDLPISQQRLLIRTATQRLSPAVALGFERTQAAVALIMEHTHGARMSLDQHLWLRVISGTIMIYDDRDYPADCPRMTPETSLTITGEGMYVLPGGAWELTVERLISHAQPLSVDTRGAGGEARLSITLALRDDALIDLRARRVGDRFKPQGMGGHSQKLSDTLINMKVPTEWRARIPLLVISGEIAWFVAPLADGPQSRVAAGLMIPTAEQSSIWRFTFYPIL